jgi:two-component system, NtrC family, response regulator HydG
LVRLAQHPFPGNVRELRNVLERAALLTDGDAISEAVIERALSVGGRSPAAGAAVPGGSVERASAKPHRHGHALREAQREALRAALASHHGNREALARTLGISVRTLYRRLESLDSPQ